MIFFENKGEGVSDSDAYWVRIGPCRVRKGSHKTRNRIPSPYFQKNFNKGRGGGWINAQRAKYGIPNSYLSFDSFKI